MINTTTKNTIEHLVTESLPVKKAGTPPTPFLVKLIRLGFKTLGYIFPEKASDVAFKFFGTPRIRARHKVSDEIIDAAKKSDIIVNDLTIKMYEWGSGDKTVLLVHGWESRGTALRTFIPTLIAANYKIIAFDGPAHGDSGGKHAHLASFAEVIAEIIKRDDSIENLIVHSFGGPTAVYALANFIPEIAIKKLVLIASPSAISVPIKIAIKFMQLPPKVAKRFIQKVEAIVKSPIDEMTVTNFAKKVTIDKVLIVHDIKDNDVPIESAMKHLNAFENAQMVTTEGLGHYKIMKNQKVINRITDFIINK